MRLYSCYIEVAQVDKTKNFNLLGTGNLFFKFSCILKSCTGSRVRIYLGHIWMGRIADQLVLSSQDIIVGAFEQITCNSSEAFLDV